MYLVNKKRGEKLELIPILALAVLIIITSVSGVYDNNSINNSMNISLNMSETTNITTINATFINNTINLTQVNITNVTTINETLINETINITNQTIINESLGEILIINKSIKINLEYNTGTPYDENNDGIETLTGVIDFTVANTKFNWAVDEAKLCTRWETYSIDNGTVTTICYGSEKCCNFVELALTSANWNETFYLNYGKYGATYNNTISAQVIYVDYNLSIDELYAEIYYSSWRNLTAEFRGVVNITEPIINITNIIIVNKTIKQYKAVIGKPVKWKIRIKYSNATKANITVPKEVINFSVKKIIDNKEFEIEKEKIKIKKDNIVKTIDEFELDKITGYTIRVSDGTGLLSRLLNWLFNKFNSITGYVVVDVEEENETKIIIEEEVEELEIEYYTEAPIAVEEETLSGKRITVSAALNYTDILTFASIKESAPEAIKLYWYASEEDYKRYVDENYLIIGDNRKIKTDITYRSYFDVSFEDENANGLIDTIYWITPHTSEQEFEISLTIINIQSYPTLFGNWTVRFDTTGTANLSITASNGTIWNNAIEDNDLWFLEIRCGGNVLAHEWIDNSMFIENYNCPTVGYHTVKVLTTGKHTQQFVFGDDVEYAYNVVAEPGGETELRVQQCDAENLEATKGTFADSCSGTYPAECGAAADRLSCDDGKIESFSLKIDQYAGIRINSSNSSVTDCDEIDEVLVCYEWWASVTSTDDCDISVDNDGGASYVAVTTTCPGNTANPGVTCADATSLEDWSCSDFFGAGATGALIKSEADKTTGGTGTLNWDVLFFNVSYNMPPTIIIDSPKNNSFFNTTNISLNYNVSDRSGIDTCIFTNVTGQNNTLAGCANTTFTALANQLNNITLYANDTIGNKASEQVFFTVDTIKPTISFAGGTESNNTYFSRDWIYVNVTANDTNEANITFYLYNSSLINVNTTTLGAGNRSINFTNLNSNEYYFYNVTITDKANNQNSTKTRKITLDTTPPNITSIVYNPNSSDNVDPNVNITFNATVTDTNIDTVILQYHNGTGWANVTMSNTTNKYNATITLLSTQANYTFNIWANDTSGNANQTANQTFSSEWDCTWQATSDLGAIAGWDENKWIGNITINNTGDSQHASGCSLDFRLTYDPLAEGRIYFDDKYYKPSSTYTIATKSNQTIVVNATFEDEVLSEDVIITITEETGISTTSSRNVTATIVSNQAGPYLYQVISSAPSSVYLTPGNFSLQGYIRNLMGSSTVNENNTAYNVSFYWSLPSGLINVSGNLTLNFTNITDNDLHYNNIDVGFSNLASMSQGAATIYLYAQGYNISGDLIEDANNQTLLSETASIIFLCYLTSDGVCVTSCGYLLDSDCEQETITVTVSGGGGGGGGGAGAGDGAAGRDVVETEAIYELVRGKDKSFFLPINNTHVWPMQNITVKVTGFLAKYIKIKDIPREIPANSSASITIDITAPRYFSKGEFKLNFLIESIITKFYPQTNATQTVHHSERRAVLLMIHELSREDASELINLSLDEIIKLENLNLSAKKLRKLLADSEDKLKARDYEGVQELHESIKEKVERALEAYDKIQEFIAKIAKAKERNIETPDTQRLVLLAKSALEREDYLTAFARLKEIELTFALETKGEFSIVDFVKRNPLLTSFMAFYLLIFAISVYFKIKIEKINYELRNLLNEKGILSGLMETAQHECFEKKTIDMAQYNTAMLQYENKLSSVVQRIIKLEAIKASLIRPALHRLELERKRLLDLIKQTQDEYIVRGQQETGVYKSKIHSYSTRLTEIEGKVIVKEAEAAIRKERRLKFLSVFGIKVKPKKKKEKEKPKEHKKPAIISKLNLYFENLIKRKEEIKQHRKLLKQQRKKKKQRKLEEKKLKRETEKEKRRKKAEKIVKKKRKGFKIKNKIIENFLRKWKKKSKWKQKKTKAKGGKKKKKKEKQKRKEN